MAVARGVVAMLETHWDALEGDWALHLHRDLVADVFSSPVGMRRLKVLIESLPRNSATARSANWPWTDGEELAATTAELMAEVSRSTMHLVAAQSKDGKYQPGEPALKVPRPWVHVEPVGEQQPLTRHDIRASFNL